jgi:hypothetical protein
LVKNAILGVGIMATSFVQTMSQRVLALQLVPEKERATSPNEASPSGGKVPRDKRHHPLRGY